MAKGKVIFVSPNQGMLVVAHADGFSVVEMLGSEGDIELADELDADWSELGGGLLSRNGEAFDVFFQGTWAAKDPAVRSAALSG